MAGDSIRYDTTDRERDADTNRGAPDRNANGSDRDGNTRREHEREATRPIAHAVVRSRVGPDDVEARRVAI